MYSERVYDNEGLILKAGTIILKGEKILLLFRSKWNDWSFPKGHVEEGETIEDCLLREVNEETGLKVNIIKNLPDIIYEYPEGDGTVRIKMFLTEPFEGELKEEYKGDRLLWLRYNDALEKLSYENNKELIESVRRIFE